MLSVNISRWVIHQIKFWQQWLTRNNCESVPNKDIEGYLRVVAFGLGLIPPDPVTLLKAPGIVKTAHGNPLGNVARQTPNLLRKALHVRELGHPVKQTWLYRINCCISQTTAENLNGGELVSIFMYYFRILRINWWIAWKIIVYFKNIMSWYRRNVVHLFMYSYTCNLPCGQVSCLGVEFSPVVVGH